MKKFIPTICAVVFVMMTALPASAMETLPDVVVRSQLTEAECAYLGLAEGTESFRFSEIRGEFLLVNMYSLYCAPCQREAPELNTIFSEIQRLGLGDRIKFLGIGAGNTVREVEFWRRKFGVVFPLIPDEEYELHQAFGSVGTPFFALARIQGPDKLEVLYTREGTFENVEEFLTTLLVKSSVDGDNE